MIESYRSDFNARFTDEKYAELLRRLDAKTGTHVEFRVAETPCFFPRELMEEMVRAGVELTHQLLDSPEYMRLSEAAIPAEFRVPNEDAHPHFMTVDFGLVRDAAGALAQHVSATGGATWDLLDGLGSTVAGASGGSITQLTSYDDWGGQEFSSGGWSAPESYTGHSQDPTQGTVQTYARTYDPGTGTWTSPDTWRGLLTQPTSSMESLTWTCPICSPEPIYVVETLVMVPEPVPEPPYDDL